MRIGIDIDGVLNNLEEFQRTMGTRFCYENGLSYNFNPNEYKIRNMFHWDRTIEKQFYDTYYSLFLTTSIFLRNDAVDALDILYRTNTLFLITARLEEDTPLDSNQTMHGLTQNWLNSNHLCYDYLLFSPPDKLSTIAKYDLDLMIEDNPYLLIKSSCSTIPFFCFNAAYNQFPLPSNVTRIYSWYEILILLDEKYNLFKGRIYE